MKTLLFAIVAFTAFSAFPGVSDRIAFRTVKDIAYSGDSETCKLDLRVPVGYTNFATIVSLHGGGLVAGRRSFAPWPETAKDRDPVAGVSVSYRFLDKATPEEVVTDAAAAIAWTLDHIAAYGGDPKKVFVTGISAGGYLTAMTGLDAKWLAKFGHRPADLAGIAPMTGQMTKHFNVRKIGFRDTDKQFQPKIDAWAPLAYAAAAGLPPVCLMTGGRDLEWACRVEENELLAVSLRHCGHKAVEFHETEGDHGGGVRPSTPWLRDFVFRTVDADGVARFAPGERVVFYGDSITHGGWYVAWLQLFQSLRHPGSGVRLVNVGRSGDSAGGGLGRFDADLLPERPARAFVMFGMNDVGRDNWHDAAPDAKKLRAREKSVAEFDRNTRRLADRLAAAGVKTTLVTPTPFDQYGDFKTPNIPFCNDGLALCAERVRALARERHLGLVDLHAPMTALFKVHAADRHFCADRVHPGPDGHLVMAAYLIDAMRYGPCVARVAIDTAASPEDRMDGCENARVTAFRATAKGVAFTYGPKALPFPKTPEYESADKVYPFTERFNRETFIVKGLAEGAYEIAFDGKTVGRFDAKALASGVNIALLDTPNQLRAQALVAPMRELRQAYSGLRNVRLVENMLHDAKIDIADWKAADAWLDAWLERQRKSPWYSGLKGWVTGYRNGRAKAAATCARIEDLHEILDAVRPAVSRVTLTKAD